MLKLSTLIPEAAKLNLNTKEGAAEYIIRRVWKFMSRDDYFSPHQFFLWLDNEREVAEESDRLAQQFYPNEEDPSYKFRDDITAKLEDLERAKHSRMLKKMDTSDPLFILKSLVKGKTYEGAKQTLVNNCLGAWGYRGGKIQDDEAEQVFNRLYKNAMGETVYDMERAKHYGRLSDLQVVDVNPNTPNLDYKEHQRRMNQYAINIFIQRFTNHGIKFPEKVKVYRGTNNPNAGIRPGDFVTFQRDYASSYERGPYGAVVSDILPSKDLFVYEPDIDRSEMVYWPEGHQIKKYDSPIPSFREFWEQFH